MSRIHDFTLICQDAWLKTFLYTVLEEDTAGDCKLNVYYEKKTHTIDISDQDAFIRRIENTGISNMDNRYYEEIYALDGWSWSLRIAYDDKEIVTGGSNAVGKELVSIFKLIECKHRVYPGEIHKKGRILKDDERIELICGARDLALYLINVNGD